MYLKALEVSNFKSFKGEVTIPLERGFTAITGPNGSGKSNCGDAIQFVLGPRSNKTIRAQNSKDLIFNGGNNNKPAIQEACLKRFTLTPLEPSQETQPKPIATA